MAKKHSQRIQELKKAREKMDKRMEEINERREKAAEAIKKMPLKSSIPEVEKGIRRLTGKEGKVENLKEAIEKAEKFTEALYEQGRIDKGTRNALRAGSGEEQVIRTSKIIEELGLEVLKKKQRKEM